MRPDCTRGGEARPIEEIHHEGTKSTKKIQSSTQKCLDENLASNSPSSSCPLCLRGESPMSLPSLLIAPRLLDGAPGEFAGRPGEDARLAVRVLEAGDAHD